MPILSSDEITRMRTDLLQTGIFSELVTIQEYTTTTSASGGQIKKWVDKTGYVAIPCYVSSVTSQEQKKNLIVQTTIQTRILLSGYYPVIKEAMRAICNGITYDITSVGSDSQTLFTKMIVQVVTT